MDKTISEDDVKPVAEKGTHENKEVEIEKPIPKLADSIFSSSSDYSRYKGFLNALALLMVSANIYFTLDYALKYGLLVNLSGVLWAYFKGMLTFHFILAILGRHILSLFSLLLEILLAKGILKENIGLVLILLSLVFEVSIAPIAVYFTDSFMVAWHISASCLTVFCKLISYHVENYRYRRRILAAKAQMNNTSSNQSNQSDIPAENSNMIRYPDNLNIKNFYYFIYAPTFVYELNFPRTPNVRKGFLIKRFLETSFVFAVLVVFMQQVIVPVAFEYQNYCQGGSDYLTFALLRMKFSGTWLWVLSLSYYLLFYSTPNILSELMRFGDRRFFADWWNSCSMRNFWANWNIPVHRWGIRYIFKPLLSCGFSQLQAISAVFFVSGIFHEYAFSFYMKTYQMPFVLFFLLQIPFVLFASPQANSQSGNMAVWIIIVISLNILLPAYILAIRLPPGLKTNTP